MLVARAPGGLRAELFGSAHFHGGVPDSRHGGAWTATQSARRSKPAVAAGGVRHVGSSVVEVSLLFRRAAGNFGHALRNDRGCADGSSRVGDGVLSRQSV